MVWADPEKGLVVGFGRRAALMVLAMVPLAARAEPIDPPTPDDVGAGDVVSRNVAAVRAHHALLDAGKVAEAVQSFAVDARNHGVPVGRKGFLRVLSDIFTTFPDWRMEIVSLDAVGERCCGPVHRVRDA